MAPANDGFKRLIAVLPRQVIIDLNSRVATVTVHNGKTKVKVAGLTSEQVGTLANAPLGQQLPDWFRAKVTHNVIEDARP